MKQIEEYVNKVYRKVNGDKAEIQELKLEMTNHLYESVHELISEGKSEEEAVKVAIERFGKESELRTVINQMFTVQRAFGIRLLYTGSVIFVLSIIVFMFTAVFPLMDEKSDEKAIAKAILSIANKAEIVESTDDRLTITSKEPSIETAEAVKISILTQSRLNESARNEITAIIENAEKKITHVVVKRYTKASARLVQHGTIYEYSRDINPIVRKFTTTSYFTGNLSQDVFIQSEDYGFIGIIALFVGMVSFLLLFFIWVIIKIYHRKKPSLSLLRE